MRRREKFITASLLLGLGLLAVQYVSLDFRYGAVALFGLFSYFLSAWALSDDLQAHEWITVVPFPSLYALGVSFFYFLLPSNFWSRLVILSLFGGGMYALYLTANIFSVAKGRGIQLLHAAHAVGLLFTLLTSILFTNTIFSLHLHWFSNGVLILLTHAPLVFLALWSVRLEQRISRQLVALTMLLTVLLTELAIVFSFYPFSLWFKSLFIMSFFYVALGLLQNYLQEKLFRNTLIEYIAAAVFIGVIFLVSFPLK